MKPSVHLSRTFGYRELGMYDQSFLVLEEIEGVDRFSFEVLEAKYLTCKAAKKWEYAEAYSNGMRIYHPNRIDGWINKAECLCELHGAEKAGEASIYSKCLRVMGAKDAVMNLKQMDSLPDKIKVT